MPSPLYKHIVVKIGTNVITGDGGLLDGAAMRSLVDQIVAVQNRGTHVILVSSGAVAAGRAAVKPDAKMGGVAQRQLLAAVGQVRLMHAYDALFGKHGKTCAQVLATKEDFRDRQHYLNMRSCFSALAQQHVMPIVNENDVVSVSELMFTDNDELAGLIASMMDSEALILLTSVDGISNGDPNAPGSQVIHEVRSSRDWKKYLRPEQSSFGRGGMHTKCRTAEKLATLGIVTHIANGRTPTVLPRILDGECLGTAFLATKRASSLKRWVAGSEGREKGTVRINTCAEELLLSRVKAVSLLPVGVTAVEGEFEKGDVIRIRGENGKDIGLGLAQYSSAVARECMGKQKQKPLVRYDYLFLSGV